MAAEESSLPTNDTEAARAVWSAAEPYELALPVTADELPPAESPPILLTESWQKPKPPHPSFGWSILWCALFLIVTQLIPGIGVAVIVLTVKSARAGSIDQVLNEISTKEGMKRFQSESILPSLLVAEICVITFSLLIIRLVVG